MMASERRDKGSSISRALRILEQVVEADRPLTATEINETLDLPKPTLHRLCQTLIDEGYLQRKLDGRRLIPGPALSRLSFGTIGSGHLRAERHTILKTLSEQIGETCNISVPDGDHMIYFDRVETHWPLRMQLAVGSHVPLHCTAAGKLYLSSLPPAQRKRLIAKLPLDSHTPNTLTSPERLEEELKLIREEYVGRDNEEFIQGMVAVAVPIFDRSGRLCAGVATHAPTQRLSFDAVQDHIPALRAAATALSDMIWHMGDAS